MPVSKGATIHGTGTVTRKDGTVVHFELKSKPLTENQAEAAKKLNIPEATHGGNSPSSS